MLLSIVVIGMILKSVLVLAANRQVGYTVARVATDLRLGLIRSLLAARWEYYLRQPVGALANSLATEATRGAESYLYGATVIALGIQAVVYSIVALLVSWQATLIALAAGTVFVFLLNRLVHASRRAGAKQTRLLRSLLARLSDNLQSVKPLKAMARENLANALLEADTTQLNRALRKDVFSKEALRALQEPMLAILIAAGLYVALVRFGMSLASVMLLAFLLVRVLLYMSRMQREYQRMVTSESAYWSMQAAIEGAAGESENPPRGRDACAAARDPLRGRRLPVSGRVDLPQRRHHDSRGRHHGDRRRVGRRQDDGDRPRRRAAAAAGGRSLDRRAAARARRLARSGAA